MDHKFTKWYCTGLMPTLLMATAGIVAGEQRSASLNPPNHATASSTQSRPAGAELMRGIVDRIEQHQTISAKVRHRASLFDQRLVGSGVYLQRESEQGTQIHFALSVKAGERLVSLLHVTDGRFLYLRDNLDDRLKVGRVDLQRLRRSGAGEEEVANPAFWMTGGGLPQLLRSLQANFQVSVPQSVLFQGVPVWALACTWDAQRLAEIWPDAEQLCDASGKLMIDRLPEQFPDRIFLLVGQDDLFPYRIDYRRSQPADRLSRLAGDDDVSRSIATMELFEVQFDAPLDPLLFAYRPGNDEKLEDRTDDYLIRLKRNSARSVAVRSVSPETEAKQAQVKQTAATPSGGKLN